MLAGLFRAALKYILTCARQKSYLYAHEQDAQITRRADGGVPVEENTETQTLPNHAPGSARR